ncbi:MAG: CotH kinase family protein [Vicinamibacterales bacterium]
MRRTPALLSLGTLALATLLVPGTARAQGQERPVVAQFDTDKDGRLNADERNAARAWLAVNASGRRGGGGGGFRAAATPGERMTPEGVRTFADAPLYQADTLRTFFIEFDNPQWEAEMVAFNNTDVEVPATVRVDGKVYRNVGIHFRGNSSFNVGDGRKRSLNLKFDFVDDDQEIGGYQTLNFLNANGDPTLLRSVVSMHIARQYIAAPKANFVRVVINGEYWGVYSSLQQFDKQFLRDNFDTTRGTRWKVPQGGFGGGVGGFIYSGDDPETYRYTFQIKTKDDPDAWKALIGLARTLADTPSDRLEAALEPILDVDAFLRFMALDTAMANGDGFYQRVADYSLYLDPRGRFHFVFHDANEMFSTGGGRGGPGGGGVFLNPFAAAAQTEKPIISKILAVPALRARYVRYVRDIAETWLDWKTIGPVVQQYRELIAADVARDTRKLFSTEEFDRSTTDAPATTSTLRTFFEQRRAFLLSWADGAAGTTAPR